MNYFRRALEQIADRGFYLCHPCLRWRDLRLCGRFPWTILWSRCVFGLAYCHWRSFCSARFLRFGVTQLQTMNLVIDRLFWKTRVSLRELRSVKFDPTATHRSIRTFGNGGFFSFTGYFRNKELGSYRAFMTDRRRAVVLRFPSSVIVISPDRPENFVSTISQYARVEPRSPY